LVKKAGVASTISALHRSQFGALAETGTAQFRGSGTEEKRPALAVFVTHRRSKQPFSRPITGRVIAHDRK